MTILRGVLPILTSFALAGCTPGPDVAPVSGRVTLNGKPLPPCEGRITFHPDKGRIATAPLDADGRYVLTTFQPGDGALVGAHKVTIKATKIVTGSPTPKSFDQEVSQAQKKGPPNEPRLIWIVPSRFVELETTPLSAEVLRKSNTIDFDITP